jgi:hypothetical protein
VYGYRVGSNARIKPPLSSSSAQGGRPAAKRMPAVLESGRQDSAGSKELEMQPGSARGGDPADHGPSAVAEADSRHSRMSQGSVQMATLEKDAGTASRAKPAANTSSSGKPGQTRAAERASLLRPSRARTPPEEDVPLAEEFHLPMPLPVPSAHQSTMQITDSAALPASLPASGQLSHTRQLSRPFESSTAKPRGPAAKMPWEKTESDTIFSLPPSETSRQPLPPSTNPGPSLADVWAKASAGSQA